MQEGRYSLSNVVHGCVTQVLYLVIGRWNLSACPTQVTQGSCCCSYHLFPWTAQGSSIHTRTHAHTVTRTRVPSSRLQNWTLQCEQCPIVIFAMPVKRIKKWSWHPCLRARFVIPSLLNK